MLMTGEIKQSLIPVMKIVIADDSDLMRERIRRKLSEVSKAELVGEAETGVNALELIKQHKPGLVILDIRMPDMDGIRVLKKIREMDLEVKTCILTNYPYSQYRKRCFDAGVDYFLSKTDDFDELSTIINSLGG
jgi:DNA-binding NarL/FixJ family response regulator